MEIGTCFDRISYLDYDDEFSAIQSHNPTVRIIQNNCNVIHTQTHTQYQIIHITTKLVLAAISMSMNQLKEKNQGIIIALNNSKQF